LDEKRIGSITEELSGAKNIIFLIRIKTPGSAII